MLMVQIRHLFVILPFPRFLYAVVLTLLNWKSIQKEFLSTRGMLGVFAPAPKAKGGNFYQVDQFHEWIEMANENMGKHHRVAMEIMATYSSNVRGLSVRELILYDFGFLQYVNDEWQRKRQQYKVVKDCYLDALNMHGMRSTRCRLHGPWVKLAMLTPTYP